MATKAAPKPSLYHRADASQPQGRYIATAIDVEGAAPQPFRFSDIDFATGGTGFVLIASGNDVSAHPMQNDVYAGPMQTQPLIASPEAGSYNRLLVPFLAGLLLVFAVGLGGLSFLVAIPSADQIAPTAGFFGLMLAIAGLESSAA